MPNWCENYLRLEVPTKRDADIIEAVLNENEEVYEEFRKDYIPKGCVVCLSGVNSPWDC